MGMLPPMKSMKAGASKAMTKGALLKTIATEHQIKTKACSNVLNSLVALVTQEVKKNGVFTLPGLCRIKTRVKPATKATVRMMLQGDQGEGKASKDSRESFRSCCPQEANLDGCI